MHRLTLRQMGIETLRACLVLALVFLSFAHAPAFAANSDALVVLAQLDATYCGDAPEGEGKAHAPCHACRLGAGADLPPPPGLPITTIVVAAVAYGVLPVLHLPAGPPVRATARGPPAA